MSLQAKLATVGGDMWRSWRCVSLWPWPAVVYGFPHSRLTADDYRLFTTHLLPGDMLLSKAEPYFLSNRGIKATVFKHLAVYTGSVEGVRDTEDRRFITSVKSLGIHRRHKGIAGKGTFERTIVHAISDGIVCQDLMDVFSHNDFVAAVRPWSDSGQQQVIVDSALAQLGLGYNFDFTPSGPREFYCTELGVYCCKRAAITPPEMIKINVDWKGLVLPLDRFKADVTVADAFVRTFKVLCVSDSCKVRNFHKESAYSDELRVLLNEAIAPSTRS